MKACFGAYWQYQKILARLNNKKNYSSATMQNFLYIESNIDILFLIAKLLWSIVVTTSIYPYYLTDYLETLWRVVTSNFYWFLN